ncbi:MAG: tail fiber domain-containing protein, partial [bacterium]
RISLQALSTGTVLNLRDSAGTSKISLDTRSGVNSYFNTGNVGIGTTSPGDKLDIRNGKIILTDDDVVHPVTSMLPTNAYGALQIGHATAGGVSLRGITDGNVKPVQLYGVFGLADPTDTIPAIEIVAGKWDGGTDIVALGATETAFWIDSDADGVGEFTMLGGGNVGIGTTTPIAPLNVIGNAIFGMPAGTPSTITLNGTGPVITSESNRTLTIKGNALDLNPDNFGTIRMVSGGGNVGVGTSTPAYLLDVDGDFRVGIATKADTFFVDTSEGNVGIGTASPASKLNVSGGNSTFAGNVWVTGGNGIGHANSAGVLAVGGSGATYEGGTIKYFGGTHATTPGILTFHTGGAVAGVPAERMRIDINGNVGIGTTSPSYKLDVMGGIASYGSSFFGGAITATSTLNVTGLTTLGNASTTQIGSTGSAYFATTAGNVGIGTTSPWGLLAVEQGTETNSFVVSNTGSSTPSFVVRGVNGNGNVGIGITNPGYKFVVASAVAGAGYEFRATGSSYDNILRFYNSSSGDYGLLGMVASADGVEAVGTRNDSFNMYSSDTGGIHLVAANAAGYLTFQTGGITLATYERMRITAGGNIGIGTTSPQAKLHIANDGTYEALRLDGGTTAGSTVTLKFLNGAGSYASRIDSYYGSLNFYVGTTASPINVLNIPGSGANAGYIGIGTTTPTQRLDVYGGNIMAESGNPEFILFDNEAASGDRRWNFKADLGTLWLQAVTDNDSSAQNWMRVQRSGNTVSNIHLSANQATTGSITLATALVGINTTGPDRRLDILDASAPQLRLTYADNSTYADFQVDSNGDLIVGVDGITNQLVLDNSGSVGIGTSTPQWLLNPYSATAPQLALSAGAGVAQWAFRNAGGNLYFATTTVAGTATSSLSTLTILGSNGNVGIGTTTPGYNLDVVGNLNATAVYSNGTLLSPGTGSNWSVSGPDIWRSSGNVGIGTAPDSMLTIQGSAPEIHLKDTGTNYATFRFYTNGTEKGTFRIDNDSNFRVDTAGNEAFRVSAVGNMGIGDTDPTEAKLVVNGAIYAATFTSANTAGLCWDNSGGSIIYDCSDTPTDLAENFGTNDITLKPGDLVVADSSREGSIFELPDDMGNNSTVSKAWVEKANIDKRAMLLGVISTSPNQVYGGDELFDPEENPLPVTLTGRVPVNIASSSPVIAIGDMVTVSLDTPGKAAKAETAGMVLGSALSSYDPLNPPADGKILVFINIGWFDGGIDHNLFFNMVGYGSSDLTLGTNNITASTVGGFNSHTRIAGANADSVALSIFGESDGITERTAPYLTVSSGSMGTTTADILVVDHSGNVGIGTSTPAWKLNIATAGLPQLALTDMNADTDKKHGLISFIGGIFSIGTPLETASSTSSASNGAGANMSTSTTYFTISDTGSVGIGTTTPARKLSVSGSVGFDGLTAGFGAGSLCLSSDGEVVYNSGSDSCLPSLRETKHNITSLENSTSTALEKIAQLVPVSFIYNEGDNRVRYGLVAEDSALIDEHLGTYDAEGNLTGVDDRALISLSIKALKELAEKNKTYETYMTDRTNASTTDAVLDELEQGSTLLTATSTVIVTDSSFKTYDRFVELVRGALLRIGIVIENGLISVKNFATDMLSAKYAIINDLTVDALTVNNKLCVEDVCVDKEQLKALLMERGGSTTQIINDQQPTTDGTGTSTDLTASTTDTEQTADTATASSTSLESSNESLTEQAEPVLTEPAPEPTPEPVVESTPTETAPESVSEPVPEVAEPVSEPNQ